LPKLIAELDNVRLTKTHRGRGRQDIQEVIERLARDNWRSTPLLTARAIFKAAIKEIDALPDPPPKQWKIDPKKPIEDEKNRLTEAIKKRIARIPERINDIYPEYRMDE
jgi:hypothetical protein